MDAVVLLHLTCLTVWPRLLEKERHSWGESRSGGHTDLMGSRYETTRMFPHISPPPFIITRGWEDKYLQGAMRNCWRIGSNVWYDNFLSFSQGISKRRAGNGGSISLKCIIAVLWVILLWKHTHTVVKCNLVHFIDSLL